MTKLVPRWLLVKLGWLVVKVPPTLQPMAILLLAQKIALAIVLWTVSVLAHGWISWIALGLAIPVTLWVFGYIFHRYGTAWRRIYFGLMDYHAGIVSTHLTVADMTEGRMAFDRLKPLLAIIRRSSSNMADNELETCLQRWKSEFDTKVVDLFESSDRCFHELYAELHPTADEFEVTTEVISTRAQMLKKENYDSYLLRYVIGQIIGNKVGLDQKKRYWKAVLTGKVV